MNSDNYTFSQSKEYVFLVKNGGSLYIIAVLVIIATAIIGFKQTFQFYRLLYVLMALSTAVIFTGYYLKKVACRIQIDFKENKIDFDMCRGAKQLLSFDDLVAITFTRRNVVFLFQDKKILFNGIQDKPLIDTIIRLKEKIKKS